MLCSVLALEADCEESVDSAVDLCISYASGDLLVLAAGDDLLELVCECLLVIYLEGGLIVDGEPSYIALVGESDYGICTAFVDGYCVYVLGVVKYAEAV